MTEPVESSFEDLTRAERMLLLRFVCSFAWADFEVRDEEVRFVRALVHRLEFDAEERREVAGWLDRPPSAESVDPRAIPRRHRELFLAAAECVVAVDGEIAIEEQESLEVLEKILGEV
ncbi:MAG: TerB family tellurite resistance protein [Myxococcales bacterium]|nr:TerB family tellurite resistance protein [Myxococcales bacterium]